MLKTIVVILTTFMLALSAAPVRSFESATADDTARFLAGLSPSSDSPLRALTKDFRPSAGLSARAEVLASIMASLCSAALRF
jgi:hypothetical protein